MLGVEPAYGSQDAILIALLLTAAAPDCTFDRAAILKLPQQAFEQDMTGGWRALPKLADFDPQGSDGKPISIRRPMNLNVLDGFARCRKRPYKEAYETCTTPIRVVKTSG